MLSGMSKVEFSSFISWVASSISAPELLMSFMRGKALHARLTELKQNGILHFL